MKKKKKKQKDSVCGRVDGPLVDSAKREWRFAAVLELFETALLPATSWVMLTERASQL